MNTHCVTHRWGLGRVLPGRTRYSLIGLDVGSRHVKAVQFVTRGTAGPRTVHACVTLPRSVAGAALDIDEARRIMEALWRQNFQGTTVAMCVPPATLLASVMELPPRASGAPLDVIARAELARSHKCDPAGIELAWWDLPGGARASEGTHAIGVGCRQSDAEAIVRMFEQIGVDVAVLDVPILALTRACSQDLAPAPNLTALVDLGWRGADLVIVSHGTVVYERSMKEIGIGAVVAKLQAALGVDTDTAEHLLMRVGCGVRGGAGVDEADFEQAAEIRAACVEYSDSLVAALDLSVGYATRRFAAPISATLLMGGGALLPGVCEWLTAKSDREYRRFGRSIPSIGPEAQGQSLSVDPAGGGLEALPALAAGLAARDLSQEAREHGRVAA
jgi:Tfp pilus assembly PilM family ATPase